jgi:hypothetical protein
MSVRIWWMREGLEEMAMSLEVEEEARRLDMAVVVDSILSFFNQITHLLGLHKHRKSRTKRPTVAKEKKLIIEEEREVAIYIQSKQ